MKKIEIIVTTRKAYHALSGEWFQKSENGKYWELWTQNHKGEPEFLKGSRIVAKRVLYTTPFKEEEAANGGFEGTEGQDRESYTDERDRQPI